MASQAPFTAPATASAPAASRARPGALPSWLFAVAALVFLMVVIGGITRLTESGLSMVRWEPVSGAIPPLDAEAWRSEERRGGKECVSTGSSRGSPYH